MCRNVCRICQEQNIWETKYSETIPQPFGYTGYRREETKGSYHGGARIYQAGTGTFTAKDDNRYINPLNPRTLNLYQYCQGNPMAYTDPTGHEALMEGSQIADLILYCPESLEKTYLERTLECLLLNNFSQEVTGAGIGIKVGLGVAGVDLPFDIVNIIADLCQYDDLKYKTRQEWWGNFALDVLAFAPLIGLEKYAKYLTDAKAVFKPVMKKAGEKQLDGGVRVAKGGSTQGADFYVAPAPNGKTLSGQYKPWTGDNIRDSLMNSVDNPQLKNAIGELYRPGSIIGNGGTADVIRFERETGILLSKSSHIQKGIDMSKYFEKLINSGTLPSSDLSVAQKILADLLSALGGS